MSEFKDLPLIEIRTVAIKLDTGDIKRINFRGTKSIFKHPEVTSKISQGGKITTIEGILRYKGADFDFKIGHTIGMPGTPMSHIFVAKKTSFEQTEFVPELYQLLYGIYRSVFL